MKLMWWWSLTSLGEVDLPPRVIFKTDSQGFTSWVSRWRRRRRQSSIRACNQYSRAQVAPSCPHLVTDSVLEIEPYHRHPPDPPAEVLRAKLIWISSIKGPMFLLIVFKNMWNILTVMNYILWICFIKAWLVYLFNTVL